MPIFFPDNPLREARYRELFADINHNLNQLQEKTAVFQRELASATATVKQKFGHLAELAGTTHLSLEEKELGDITLPLSIANVIASTALGAVVSRGIQVALLANPARQAWAATQLFGRLGFTRGGVLRGAGGFGAAALIGLLIQGVGEAISGAISRDELRKGIAELLEPRVNAYRAAHMMSIAAQGVGAIANAVDALPASTPAADVLATIERAYARARNQMEAQTVERSVADLARLDHQRDSYRVDDATIVQSDNLGFINESRADQALDVPLASHAEAQHLIVYPWHGRRNQRWAVETLEREHARGWGLRNQESDLMLNAAAPDGRANGEVIQWHHETGDNSMWLIAPVPLLPAHNNDRRIMIISKMSGDALDVDEAGQVLMRPATGVASQIWRFRT